MEPRQCLSLQSAGVIRSELHVRPAFSTVTSLHPRADAWLHPGGPSTSGEISSLTFFTHFACLTCNCDITVYKRRLTRAARKMAGIC
jgi:hypothetical protein